MNSAIDMETLLLPQPYEQKQRKGKTIIQQVRQVLGCTCAALN